MSRWLFSVMALLVAMTLQADEVTVSQAEGVLEVKHGQALITKYHYGETVAKPFFWPLNAPGERPVTRAWPMVKGTTGESTDHVHQKSAWFCHGDVIPHGIELKTRSADKHVKGVDFWSEAKGHGVIVCTEVGKPVVQAKTDVLVPTVNEWRTPDGNSILKEHRALRFQALDNGYLVTLHIDLHAEVCDITFGDTKEGAMGVRVPDGFCTMLKDGGTLTSSDGTSVPPNTKGTLKIWGQLADWQDYSGTVNGEPAGIAIFDHPKNSHRAAWHSRDYGLMAANPFGREESGFPARKGKKDVVMLKKGEHLQLSYAVLLHAGDVKAGRVAAAYKGFAESVRPTR